MKSRFDDLSPFWRHLLAAFATVIFTMLASYVGAKLGIPLPPIPPPPVESASPASDPSGSGPPGTAHRFGWIDDPEARRASFARLPPTAFSETPAGRIALGESSDIFLWEAVRKAANRPAPWYPNIDQRDVGCCVGCGWKHAADVCQAVQCVTRGGEFKPLSAEVIYGISRVDVGKGRISGDGSMGAWAREAVRSGGVAPMEKYPGDDLSVFSPARARKYGRSGVPSEIKAVAAEHPVRATALVQSWADAQRSIAQGYPVAVCSDRGFENADGTAGTRDSQGFCKPRGYWPHCMCLIGIRGGARPGAFCLNSWGDAAHGGPRWPKDAPVAGFWIDAATVERMVEQGDSYSLADLAGFPARDLDWFTAVRQPGDRLTQGSSR